MGKIFADAWAIYRGNWFLLTAITLIVWIPCELLISWMSYHELAGDELKTYLFGYLLDLPAGSLALCGMFYLLREKEIGKSVTLGAMFLAGFRLWMPMLLTRILAAATVILGYVLLILPGFYLTVRLSLVEATVVAENTSGFAAANKSNQRTQGHFWKIVATMCTGVLLVTIVYLMVGLPFYFIPGFNNWTTYTALAIFGHIPAVFYYSLLWATYRHITAKADFDSQQVIT